MARPFLVRVFIDELPIKVLSMVLAITLFMLVRNDKDSSSSAYVKVLYTLPDNRVLVSDPPTEVKVKVSGPWPKLQHLDQKLEPIRVDLNHVHANEVHLDEDLIKLPLGVRLAQITPAEVHVETEPRVVREVPVQPILEGEPAEGYRVAHVVAEPATVEIDGAKSEVDAMRRVPTRPLRIVDARGPEHGEAQLEPPPAHTRFVNQGPITVSVDVQPAMVERTFDAVPVRITGLTRLDALVEPATARLILRGPSVLLAKIGADSVGLVVDGALVDTRAPAKYTRNLSVIGLPAGVAAEVQPDTVALTTRHKRE